MTEHSTDKKDWIVRVYNNSDKEIATWVIKDRTGIEADREAMGEIERNYPDRDWSIASINKPTPKEIEEAFDRFFGL